MNIGPLDYTHRPWCKCQVCQEGDEIAANQAREDAQAEANPYCTCGGKGTCDECLYQRAAANCSEEDSYKL